MKFTINQDYFFLYNKLGVFYYQLGNQIGEGEVKKQKEFDKNKLFKIPLEMNRKAKYSKIRSIHAGSDPSKIIIIIDATIETDRVIEWSME